MGKLQIAEGKLQMEDIFHNPICNWQSAINT
jgi:hypothetical protein